MDTIVEANPFTPIFGRVPPFMAGRGRLLEDFDRAFSSPGADPNLSSIFVGARGTGKTALLTYLANSAESKGWVAANISAKPGMLREIYEQIVANGAHLADVTPHRKLKSLSVGQWLGAEWENVDASEDSWRLQMTKLLDKLADQDTGLLITVDEVNPSIDEMVELASIYQHFVREERKVALLLAGLPSKVSSLVSSDSVSFLRRSRIHKLGRVSNVEIEVALRTTLSEGKRALEDDALDVALEAIGGFPYLLQLVGFYLWGGSEPGKPIDKQSGEVAAKRAQADFAHGVLDATYRELSDGDIAFLAAMLEDDGLSSMRDITNRTGKSPSSTRVYKGRLLEQGIIEEERRGEVRFELPAFREYLQRRLTERWGSRFPKTASK